MVDMVQKFKKYVVTLFFWCVSYTSNLNFFFADSLRHTSAISILLAVLFVVISSAMAIHALWEGKTQKLRIFPDFSKVSVFDLFTIVPVLVTGFGIQVNGKGT